MAVIYKSLQEGRNAISQQCKQWEKDHPNEYDFILIAGSAGSGKSTFSKMIAGRNALIVSLDRYYLGAEKQRKEQGIVNFSIPDALDWKRFKKDVAKILVSKRGEQIFLPRYSMQKSKRTGEESVQLKRRIIMEGVYALRLKLKTPFRIYIDVPDALLLERRLGRDMKERGISEYSVRKRFKRDVQPALKRFVKPQKKSAAMIINNP